VGERVGGTQFGRIVKKALHSVYSVVQVKEGVLRVNELKKKRQAKVSWAEGIKRRRK
jgi:hypothetical protein